MVRFDASPEDTGGIILSQDPSSVMSTDATTVGQSVQMETKLTTFEKLCKLDPANLLDTACHRLFNDISKHVLEKVNPIYDCSNHPRLDGQLKHGFNNFVISGDHKGDARPGILIGHLPAGENQLGLAWPHLRKQAAVEKN